MRLAEKVRGYQLRVHFPVVQLAIYFVQLKATILTSTR